MWSDIHGETLLEVLSVRIVIDGMDDPQMADIEGTFQIFDIANKPIDCYKRVEGSPSVLPDGTLALSGPFRCIVPETEWNFEINLKETNNNLEICNGHYYHGESYPDGFVNRPLSVFIPGDNGYAIVNYILFERATQATIEVWIDARPDDEGCIPAIYGSIWARYNSCEYDNAFDEKHLRVTLFSVSEEKAIKLTDGKNKIPLLRSTVAVPLRSCLVIEPFLLRGSDLLMDQDQYSLIKARVSGTATETESTTGFTVKVSWDANPFRAAGLRHPFAKVLRYE